jgi:hypothetical protein
MEVDTWVGASGKNGMRRDWLIRSDVTGEVLVRATRYDSEHPHSFNSFMVPLVSLLRRCKSETVLG